MKKILAHIFTPNRSNNHRPHLLQPAGLAVLVALTLFFNSSLELIKAAPPRGLVLGYASNINANQVLQLTNHERYLEGLQPLKLNPALTQAAENKAAHMFLVDYWAHIAPDGTTPWKFIKDTGYTYSVAGENLARDFDTSQPMVKAWMGSPTHKANIVHPKYEETGIAVVNGKLDGVETTLVVQMFGAPTTAIAGVETQDPIPTISPVAQTDTAPNSNIVPQVAAAQSELTPATSTLVSPSKLKQSVSVTMILLVLSVIIVDELIIRKKQVIRFVGKNFAHISFLTVALIIVFTMSYPGGIL